jgi:hypothetical protein
MAPTSHESEPPEIPGRFNDDGSARVERPPGLGLDLAEGQIDRPGKVVVLELLGGQHIDHLDALLHQVLDLLAADLTHAEHLRPPRSRIYRRMEVT